jgi:hypothetical protein
MTLWWRESQSNWSFWWREIDTDRQSREIDQMKLWLGGGETEIKADQLKLWCRETDTQRQFREIDQTKLWLGGGGRERSKLTKWSFQSRALRWRERATAASDIGAKSPAFVLSLSLKSIKTLESDHLLHLSITIRFVYCAALTQRKRRSEKLQGVSRALAWTLMSVTYLRKAFPRRILQPPLLISYNSARFFLCFRHLLSPFVLILANLST